MFSIARSIALVALMFAATGCAQKSPEQQQMDQIRSDASNQAKAIENHAELQAAPLDQQADALSNQAKQAGGYTGKRLEVKADALQQERTVVHEVGPGVSSRARRLSALRKCDPAACCQPAGMHLVQAAVRATVVPCCVPATATTSETFLRRLGQ